MGVASLAHQKVVTLLMMGPWILGTRGLMVARAARWMACASRSLPLLDVSRQREVASLRGALGRLHNAMRTQSLPANMRWHTRARLCWQRKRSGKPRPIKIGEVLRASFAKR